MSFSFRTLTLCQAEEQLAGAAIDHAAALHIARSELTISQFRSEQAHDLDRIFNVLAAWQDGGILRPDRNRERLGKHFDPGYIDLLWCPYGVLPEYVSALCAAISRERELLTNAIKARREWQDNSPLATYRPAPPQPVHRRPQEPPPKTGVSIFDQFSR